MTRAVIRVGLLSAFVGLTAAAAPAQTTATSETKKFQVIAVDANKLVVRLPEGTRELTVPDDFRFNVDGKMLSVQELKPGMAGSATITTKTTVTPVTVTEVKNGTVMQNMGTSILVRTESGMQMFSQADVDRRGVVIYRDGRPAQITDFRANDRLTATIVTTKPPRVVTEKEVNAILATSGGAGGAGTGAGAGAGAAATPAPARAGSPSPAGAPQPRRRPPALRRGRCPGPRAHCRFLGWRAWRPFSRGWALRSPGAARRASRFAHRRRAAPPMSAARAAFTPKARVSSSASLTSS